MKISKTTPYSFCFLTHRKAATITPQDALEVDSYDYKARRAFSLDLPKNLSPLGITGLAKQQAVAILGTERIVFADTDSPELLPFDLTLPLPVREIAYRSSRHLLFGLTATECVTWDLSGLRELRGFSRVPMRALRKLNGYRHMLDPSGRLLVEIGPIEMFTSRYGGHITLTDLATNKALCSLELPDSPFESWGSIAFSSDRSHIAVQTDKETIEIWSMTQKALVWKANLNHGKEFVPMAISNSGQRLYCQIASGTIMRFRAVTIQGATRQSCTSIDIKGTAYLALNHVDDLLAYRDSRSGTDFAYVGT